MRESTRNGFTLIEVMVVTVILGMVMTITLVSMNSSSRAIAFEEHLAWVRDRGGVALGDMAEALREAAVDPLAAAGQSTVTFRLPVDHDGDGDVFDSAMNIEWGVRYGGAEYLDLSHDTPGSPQTFTQTYQWVYDSTYSEATEREDVNGDGDTDDIFELGRMECVYSQGVDPATNIALNVNPIGMTPPWVVRMPANAATQDIDGDGVDDPLFFQNGSAVTIDLHLLNPDQDPPFIVNVTSAVTLRNPQP